MTTKAYDWDAGAELAEHSRRKHTVLREYFANCLYVRSQLPYQRRFRLACIDGFAGGGRYANGEPGSPLIFLEELNRAATDINVARADGGFPRLEIRCLLILNDADPAAISQLQRHVDSFRAYLTRDLHIEVRYFQQQFEDLYPSIKRLLLSGAYRNVLFNLDQCGHVHVACETLRDIIESFPSAEIFYTFAIDTLLAFLQKTEPTVLKSQLSHLDIPGSDLVDLDRVMSKRQWLGAAERIVFETFRSCAPFVSPFSINNPDGWRYWLIHLANSYRARQVYNDVLHLNSSMQAHFGRSGLQMLHYDPRYSGNLYLFDDNGRATARTQLLDDIPRILSPFDRGLAMASFYQRIYNITPAHADDIHRALIENPDISVTTPKGGQRSSQQSIHADDIVSLRRQTSFFPFWRPTAPNGETLTHEPVASPIARPLAEPAALPPGQPLTDVTPPRPTSDRRSPHTHQEP